MTAQELTTRQRAAIAALLAAPSVLAAAHNAGVGARTLYRWLEDPTFRKALQEAEDLAIDAASRRLLSGQSQALDTLGEEGQLSPAIHVRQGAAAPMIRAIASTTAASPRVRAHNAAS